MLRKKRQRVLFVDSDTSFQGQVLSWLKPHFNVLCLKRGETLIDKLKDFEPDILLLDVDLPDYDGFSLCSYIRSIPQWQYLPIVIFSDLLEGEDFYFNLHVRGNAYLNKCFTESGLLALIRGMLNGITETSMIPVHQNGAPVFSIT